MPSKRPPPAAPAANPGAPVRIGFVALVDCAPLLAADALGLFDKHGVEVELSREIGWATVREKIIYRQLDAAHAPAGIALSLRLGIDGLRCNTLIPFLFNLNGNAISLAMDLWRRGVRDAGTLHKLVRSSPQRLYTFGVVSRNSSHHILMREWLQSGGVDPDRDVRLVVLPPTQMPGALRAGLIDGFCAGEPWNSAVTATASGWCPALSPDLAPGHPEKALVTTREFADESPGKLARIIRALHDACAWCDARENRTRVVDLLHGSGQLHIDREILRRSVIGPFHDGTGGTRDVPDLHIFHRLNANEPTRAGADWLLQSFLRHGLAGDASPAEVRAALAACWRPELFRQALRPKPVSAGKSKPRRKRKTNPNRKLQPAHA